MGTPGVGGGGRVRARLEKNPRCLDRRASDGRRVGTDRRPSRRPAPRDATSAVLSRSDGRTRQRRVLLGSPSVEPPQNGRHRRRSGPDSEPLDRPNDHASPDRRRPHHNPPHSSPVSSPADHHSSPWHPRSSHDRPRSSPTHNPFLPNPTQSSLPPRPRRPVIGPPTHGRSLCRANRSMFHVKHQRRPPDLTRLTPRIVHILWATAPSSPQELARPPHTSSRHDPRHLRRPRHGALRRDRNSLRRWPFRTCVPEAPVAGAQPAQQPVDPVEILDVGVLDHHTAPAAPLLNANSGVQALAQQRFELQQGCGLRSTGGRRPGLGMLIMPVGLHRGPPRAPAPRPPAR